MKKIKFYIRSRSTVVNELAFVESTGYLDKIVNPKNQFESVEVVYSKEETWWKSTHFKSGLMIVGACSSKKECIEETEKLLDVVLKMEKDLKIQKCIEELEYYKNNLVLEGIN